MSGRAVKVVIFVLMMIMVASMVTALLDPGLGKPDDTRRTRHTAGFSIAYPLGWGGTAYGGPDAGEGAYIRLAQERKTGRETTISVECTGPHPAKMPNATEGTFQGQPAFFSTKQASSGWQWRVQFQRDDLWFTILMVSPIPLEIQTSAYWPYIESFRMEKRITPATRESPATSPA